MTKISLQFLFQWNDLKHVFRATVGRKSRELKTQGKYENYTGNPATAMTAREVERKSERNPELCSVRQYIQTGDWSQCKLPHNIICVLGKLAMCALLFPKAFEMACCA